MCMQIWQECDVFQKHHSTTSEMWGSLAAVIHGSHSVHSIAGGHTQTFLHASPPFQSASPSRGRGVAEWDSPPPNPGSLSSSPCHDEPKVHTNTAVNTRSYTSLLMQNLPLGLCTLPHPQGRHIGLCCIE